MMLTSFCLSIRGVYEHASWAQLHTWNVHPECAWTAYGTSFTSPRSCPSDVNPPRASREAPRATLSSAYLISLCCQSAHKTHPLNPPRPSGRTEPRVAQSCRLMHTVTAGRVEVKIAQKRQNLCIYRTLRVILSYGPWDCTVVWIHYTEEFYLLTSSLLLFFIIVVWFSRPKCHRVCKTNAKRIKF